MPAGLELSPRLGSLSLERVMDTPRTPALDDWSICIEALYASAGDDQAFSEVIAQFVRHLGALAIRLDAGDRVGRSVDAIAHARRAMSLLRRWHEGGGFDSTYGTGSSIDEDTFAESRTGISVADARIARMMSLGIVRTPPAKAPPRPGTWMSVVFGVLGISSEPRQGP